MCYVNLLSMHLIAKKRELWEKCGNLVMELVLQTAKGG